MTPAAIIKEAMADGVRLALSPAGTIKATGNGDAVERWLPLIREHKPGIVAELRAANDTTYDALPDLAAEARRQRVLVLLAERPGIRYAVLTDTQADPDAVIVVLAIWSAKPDGGTVTCELAIPRAKYDGMLLLDLIEHHGGTVH